MSELQINTQVRHSETNPEDDHDDDRKFLRSAAAVVSGFALVAGAGAVGSTVNNAQRHEGAQQAASQQQVELEQYNDSIQAAINRDYDSQQVVGEIHVSEGSNLIDAVLNIPAVNGTVEQEQLVGADSYTYDHLLASAKEQNPQPGEDYSVVAVDINPEKADGEEFIVVNSEHVRAAEAVSLPSPIIADGSSNESDN